MADDTVQATATSEAPPTPPSLGKCGWTANYTACGPCDALTPANQALFEEMAADYLDTWTNGVFGVCPVAVRPCTQDCEGGKVWSSTFWGRGPRYDPGFPAARGSRPFYPLLIDGEWHNVSCGCVSQCSCDPSGPTVLALPGPIQSVTQVLIDGSTLAATAYHVSNARHLIRDDGGVWPACQNMLKPTGSVYQPITVSTGTQSQGTFNRVGNVVTAVISYTSGPGGANFAGTAPYRPAGTQVLQTVYNAVSGLQTGTLTLSTAGGFGGSSGAGFAPVTIVYFTDAAPSAVDYSDTFEVTYQRGVPVPLGGAVAQGVLACEFAKAACNDATCALPRRLQSVTRQGLTATIFDSFEDLHDNGRTGIWLIDSWVASVTKAKGFASVASVDMPPAGGW